MHASEIAKTLGGARRTTRGWSCRCPAHDDQTPSLSITDSEDGKLLVKCFAGCDACDVLAALRQRGWLNGRPAHAISSLPRRREPDNAAMRRTEHALAIWRQAVPAAGTPIERYLSLRGYDGQIPPTIRAAPSLKHSESGQTFPAMVAAVSASPGRKVIAVHRTYLTCDGSSKAPVPAAKMSLGPIAGGAVRLSPACRVLAITEGIETGLSVMLATGIPTWAALSAGGLEQLILPSLPLAQEVIICADNDANGRGQKAANIAARRFLDDGRRVRIAVPPDIGADFNDIQRMECDQ